jgi:hypothetical protein
LLTFVIRFFLGLLSANAGDWLVHKYILHAPGKNRMVSRLTICMNIKLIALVTVCSIRIIKSPD